jgi:hypothetical protein
LILFSSFFLYFSSFICILENNSYPFIYFKCYLAFVFLALFYDLNVYNIIKFFTNGLRENYERKIEKDLSDIWLKLQHLESIHPLIIPLNFHLEFKKKNLQFYSHNYIYTRLQWSIHILSWQVVSTVFTSKHKS